MAVGISLADDYQKPVKAEEAETGAELPFQEREKIACARYLGIDPGRITKIETLTDGGGHFTDLRVIIDIYTGRGIRNFVDTHCPSK